jgi:GNAT superfamily N-acetyltransferase
VEKVRTASAGDLDRLVELVATFRGNRTERRGADLVHSDDDGGSVPVPTREGVSPYLSEAGRTALVGTLDDWVAAVALCRVVDAGAVPRGVLDVCFVDEGAREVGLGHLLVERSLDWFGSEGCSGVDGIALPGDRVAKNFFESAGFKARLLVMHRPLSDRGS